MNNETRDPSENPAEQEEQQPQKKRGGGGCSGGSSGAGQSSSSDSSNSSDSQNSEENSKDDSNKPDPKKLKEEIEENDIPENWWDKLPDFDPRVYDAIMMEQAAACVNYIFEGLPDMHELENSMVARGFPKICPRLKTQVPRTKVVMPKEIKYDTKIN